MAVYSIPIELNEIITEIRGKYQKVLVIGCGGCTNESLAYIHNLPITNVNRGELTPIATNAELEKLESGLTAAGFDVRTTTFPRDWDALCLRQEGKTFQYNPHLDFEPQVILALSCPAGKFSIEEGFDHKIPVIKITRQIGHLAYFSYEDSEGFQWIDPEKTKIFNYE